MFSHNIAEVIHQSAEPEGGYTPSSPVKIVYLDGKEAFSQWGSDVGNGGVLAWRAEHGDDAATAYTPPQTPPKTLFDGAEFLSRVTDAEYAAITAAAAQHVQLARWLDIFRLRGEIDVSGATALAAKAGMVALGLLSQERADQVFAPD